MSFTAAERRRYEEAINTIVGTRPGQEAIMYPPLRDFLTDFLGYARSAIRIDVAGHRGRPDLTIMAPGASPGSLVAWIVLEAKDERGAVADPVRRLALFMEKAKYITADTAFMVMVDPTMIVIRPAAMGPSAAGDVEIRLPATLDEFFDAAKILHSDIAGVPEVLKRFREGDESLIAYAKLWADPGASPETLLAVSINQNVFYDALRETTQHLQDAVVASLRRTRPERNVIQSLVDEFEEEFGAWDFRPYPISIEATGSRGREKELVHRRKSATLRKKLSQNATMTRLTLDALPRFASRIGRDLDEELDLIERIFAIETANLILARILLIRFLEDYAFFDTEAGHRRYLCNGGVQAFQGMRAYFGFGYTRLLEEAYRVGASFYAAAFDETEMDWVFALSDADLSSTVEWAMFRFARFDFTTARGDLMTGVYDRFLDPAQRKAQGEYYTPPSIARYILSRLDLADDAVIMDPACGSGTFPIERYRLAAGDAADRGYGSYEMAKSVIERIAANDLNPFSAVLTQIQLLWQLMRFGRELRDQGFPDLMVAERANSLVPVSLLDPAQTRFGEIDRTGYDAVVGNPPYVRQERLGEFNEDTTAYFQNPREVDGVAFPGVPVDRNAYGLFIYRALDHWCRQPNAEEGKAPGKLGFIIPLGFCVSDDAAALRSLFRPGGRWTILEIVDMELIWRDVFDADVLPMILIAEARPPTADDVVSVRLADASCVQRSQRRKRATFDLAAAPEVIVPYADLFSPDGRILTRATPTRLDILRRIWALGRLEDAALPYWWLPRPKQDPLNRVTTTEPVGFGAGRWRREILIKSGVAMRGKVVPVEGGGWTVYKGENIRTAGLAGEPVFRNIDVSQASGPYVWAYAHIFPERVWAIPMIEQVPVAAPIDPRSIAVLNTASVVALRPEFANVPLDLILLSRPYVWSFAIAWRSSYQNRQRTHIYPTVIASLPWTDRLADCSDDIEAVRAGLLDLCERRFEAASRMLSDCAEIGMLPLQQVMRATPGATLRRNEQFDIEARFTLELGDVRSDGLEWVLPLSATGHEMVFDNESIAGFTLKGLELREGEEFSWNAVLQTAIPPDEQCLNRLTAIEDSLNPETIDAAIELKIDELDAVVGPALGLTDQDLVMIRRDLADDPYLSAITPRYPLFRPRQHGRRLALENSLRYSAD
jgi:hypothetical protein